ncbi:MAG: hypothetical protein ABIL09_05645 [Gemmatimonadota bacterium]
MRTTLEITDRQRAELLQIAASRGEKGFSGVVQEALELYLASRKLDAGKLTAALAVEGALDEDEARELAEACAQIRAEWR